MSRRAVTLTEQASERARRTTTYGELKVSRVEGSLNKAHNLKVQNVVERIGGHQLLRTPADK